TVHAMPTAKTSSPATIRRIIRRRLDDPSSSGGGSVRKVRLVLSTGVTTGTAEARAELPLGGTWLRDEGGGRGIDGGAASTLTARTELGGGGMTTGAISAGGPESRWGADAGGGGGGAPRWEGGGSATTGERSERGATAGASPARFMTSCSASAPGPTSC